MTSSSHAFIPSFEQNEDHYISFLTSPSQTSSSSLIRPTAFYPSQNHYQQPQEVDEYVSQGGSNDHQSHSPPSLSTLESGTEYGLKLSMFDGDQANKEESTPSGKGPVSWMSSKMRLMKKMINSDRINAEKTRRGKLWFQDHKQSSASPTTNNTIHNLEGNNAMIRTCSDCNTTRTPLWRSGPKGPKSLCNACGIRQRKARRAMAAAAAAASNGDLGTNSSSMQTKMHCTKKKSGKSHSAQHKKQCKLSATPTVQKKLGFEDFIVNLSNNLALHRVIPQDETEAAILLMALSCGLVSR